MGFQRGQSFKLRLVWTKEQEMRFYVSDMGQRDFWLRCLDYRILPLMFINYTWMCFGLSKTWLHDVNELYPYPRKCITLRKYFELSHISISQKQKFIEQHLLLIIDNKTTMEKSVRIFITLISENETFY